MAKVASRTGETTEETDTIEVVTKEEEVATREVVVMVDTTEVVTVTTMMMEDGETTREMMDKVGVTSSEETEGLIEAEEEVDMTIEDLLMTMGMIMVGRTGEEAIMEVIEGDTLKEGSIKELAVVDSDQRLL